MNTRNEEEKSVEKNHHHHHAGKTSKKGKSCKGTLYHSTALRSKAKNPHCISIPRSLPHVPHSVVEASDVELKYKDYCFVCAGFSVYLDQTGKEPSGDKRTATELPVCVGLQFVAGTTLPAAAPTAAHALNKEGKEKNFVNLSVVQCLSFSRCSLSPSASRRPKRTHSTGTDFLTRFSRNADLVASGDMGKVGNYMKESVSDILCPYRGRPK